MIHEEVLDGIMEEIKYRPVGIIHSPFKDCRGVPLQPVAAQGVEGTVEIFPEYVAGLRDIEGFSHIILIYHFHLCREFSLIVEPYLDDRLHGVFATRAPARPNPIGLSIVRLVRAENEIIHIRDVDIVDGMPLLDIKPYVAEFDAREAERIGWLEGKTDRVRRTTDDGRFQSCP